MKDVNKLAAQVKQLAQSQFRRKKHSKQQVPIWSTLVAAFIVAFATAAFVGTLNRQASSSERTEHLLILKPSLQQFFQLYNKYNINIDKEFQLIAAGQISEAITVDREEVDPSYDLLSNEIADLSTAYRKYKQQVSRTAEVGSALALNIAAIAIAVLFWKFQQAQQKAQIAIAEQKTLYQSEERLRSLLQNASDVIMVLNAEGVINYASVSANRVLSCCSGSFVGTSIFNWIHAEDITKMQNFFADCLANSATLPPCEVRLQSCEGCWCYVEVIGNNLLGNQSVSGIVLNLRDISDRQQAVEQLSHNAFHDPLTGLANRALFMERLQYTINLAHRQEDYLFAVLFLDLDRFKTINDSLGHTVGDELLVATARRLEMCLRTGDTIARLGGDEFAILLHNIQDINQATHIAERITQELTLPICLSGHEIFVSTSIGIALSSKTDEKSEDLLRNADIAMYRAKALGKARYEVFDASMHLQLVKRLQLETDLRRAIENQEFQVYYQPIVSLATGRIAGLEALVRWQHPERGFVSPAEFMPLAEETGLSIPIGQWVLHEACRQVSAWQAQYPTYPPIKLSVNLSVKQLKQPQLVEQLAQILRTTALDASHLMLEFTESWLMTANESVNATLLQLKALGVWLALDDFGTSYSSLSHLHAFPIDTLKIDRSFISRMAANDKSSEIVRACISIAQALGIDAIAEGVETAAQSDQLRTLHCEYGQGYFFSEPLDAVTVETLIAQQIPGAKQRLSLAQL